jgi:hypothetical protein
MVLPFPGEVFEFGDNMYLKFVPYKDLELSLASYNQNLNVLPINGGHLTGKERDLALELITMASRKHPGRLDYLVRYAKSKETNGNFSKVMINDLHPFPMNTLGAALLHPLESAVIIEVPYNILDAA